MYRVDRRIHKHKRARRRVLLLVIFIIVVALYYIISHLRISPQQAIRNASPLSNKYTQEVVSKILIDKPLFTLKLPSGWKETIATADIIPAPSFTFQSSDSPSLLLNIYVDKDPSRMAVNKAITISAQGNGIAYDSVSANCTTFTDPSKNDPRTNIAPARWQNTDFLCDMGSADRGVIGTQSSEGINQITVTGKTVGTHKLFIRYTDNHVTPDYTVLYGILGSLEFK